MLTDAQIRKIRGTGKSHKMFDGGGLFLQVTATGGRLWRMRYRLGGREKLLSFGPYPEVSLAKARDHRDAAREILRAGRDPSIERRIRAAQSTDPDQSFEAVARAWHAKQRVRWTPTHAGDVLGSLESLVFPKLGKLPIRDITAPMVLAVVREIERRPAIETARRVRQRISAVYVHAIAEGRVDHDPAAGLGPALAPLVKGRQPAITDLAEARKMLAKAEAQPAHPVTKLAMRLLALTAVRPGEIRAAAWEEFEDLDGAAPLWRVPAGRMKMKREHLVPLSRQAVEVIEAVRELSGELPILFPSTRWARRPMSENALGYLLNRAGYHHQHVPHGWRATFSTVMNERYRADRDVIDLMLAHVSGDKTEAAYNRAAHMPRRRELAQVWADLLLDGALAAASLLGGARR